MAQNRLDETLTSTDNTCDICGSDDESGYVKVTYSSPADADDEVVQRECFACHRDAKCRDQKRERGEFETILQ